MVAFLHTGLEQSWPPAANVGGAPAEVHCKVFPLLFSKQSQAQEIRLNAQQSLDLLSASVDEKNLAAGMRRKKTATLSTANSKGT